MIIKCRHGFFTFEEESPGEISKFASFFDASLVSYRGTFTFEELSEAAEYSILSKPYLGVPAIKTFEGDPWEIMAENDLVYDLSLKSVVPIETIVTSASVIKSDFFYYQEKLIQPGSFLSGGGRVLGYTAWYSWQKAIGFRYTEIELDV